jgi:hypothetical protein
MIILQLEQMNTIAMMFRGECSFNNVTPNDEIHHEKII